MAFGVRLASRARRSKRRCCAVVSASCRMVRPNGASGYITPAAVAVHLTRRAASPRAGSSLLVARKARAMHEKMRSDPRLIRGTQVEKVLAAVRVGPSKTEIRDFPMPDIPEDSALMKMEVAGICGTDVKLY